MELTLDVFNQDAFNCAALTDAVNALPFVPGRAGTIVPWDEIGIPVDKVEIEIKDGELQLLNPSQRGGSGSTGTDKLRKVHVLKVPHYQYDDSILADSVQNVRAFGTGSVLETLLGRVNSKLLDAVQLRLDPTLEFQRLGALKGLILNADGTTLYDLFDEFGVAQETEVDFDLDNGSPASGALRKKCAQTVRTIANNLGGIPFTGVAALCGDAFFDELLAHKEVVESYKGSSMAQVLREGYVTPNGTVYGVFEFGGIVWENYRGKNGADAMVHTDKCHLFPTGAAGLYRTVYAPADYVETVNTNGLPRYSKQWPFANGKGVHLESQSNPLSYCKRPKALMKGKRT